MSFPIVDWEINNKELQDAFRKGKAFFGNKAFVKGINDLNCFLQVSPNQIVGIDVPVMLSNGKGDKGTIMIIGESPRRDTRIIKTPGLYIGTPFAVGYKEDIPPQCKIYKVIFSKLLDAGYNVYITDAVKIWNKGLVKNDFVKLIDYPVLETEIENVKPILVVSWGETAKTACKNIFKNKNAFLHQMHPVTLNYDRWKVRMLKETIVNGDKIGKKYLNDSEDDKVKDPYYLGEFISQEILSNVPKAVSNAIP